jgi:Collagen triple helix repeat (20 copies)
MLRMAVLASLLALGCSAADGSSGKPGSDGDDGAMGLIGEPGEKGDPGERGAKGDKGEIGARGATGAKGERGSMGSPGASVTLTAEPDGSHCTVGGVKLSVGSTTDYVCDGLPGMKGDTGDKGDKGDTGLPGDKGSEGPTGPAGRFEARDGTGNTLGTFISGDMFGKWWVRTTDGAIVSYDSYDGSFDTPGSGDLSLGFVSTDCSGQPLAIGPNPIVGAGVTNSGLLYRTSAPRQVGVTIHSVREWSTGLCTADITQAATVMDAVFLRASPSAAPLPLELVDRE